MKKVGIGCLIVLGILLIALWVGARVVIHKAKKFVAGYEQLQEIPALNQQIRNQAAYDPPADGRLDTAQIERYMAVQNSMLARLGARGQQLKEKYDRLDQELKQKGREANIVESLGAMQDLFSLLMEAKRAQVDALNAAGFSYAEYQWIRQQTLITLGQGAVGLNIDTLVTNPNAAGSALAMPVQINPEALEHNRGLLKPYEGNMDQWLMLTFFGL